MTDRAGEFESFTADMTADERIEFAHFCEWLGAWLAMSQTDGDDVVWDGVPWDEARKAAPHLAVAMAREMARYDQ